MRRMILGVAAISMALIGLEAAPAIAAAHVTVKVSDHTVTPGKTVRISGTTPASKVTLQVMSGSNWLKVRPAKVHSHRYVITFRVGFTGKEIFRIKSGRYISHTFQLTGQ